MFLETLFCVGFFLTPLLGMFALVTYSAVKATRVSEVPAEAEDIPERTRLKRGAVKKVVISFRKKIEKYPISRLKNQDLQFENPQIAAYQLREPKEHRGFAKNTFKRGAHPRAGP